MLQLRPTKGSFKEDDHGIGTSLALLWSPLDQSENRDRPNIVHGQEDDHGA